MSLKSILRRFNFINAFDAEDVERAEAENASFETSKVLERFESSSELLERAQNKLRASIREARTTTESAQRTNEDALANLVRGMRSHGLNH